MPLVAAQRLQREPGMQSFRMDLEPLGESYRCRLIGCLDREAVAESRRQFAVRQLPAVLDLGDLVQVDAHGLELVAELRAGGCTIERLKPFFALRLDDFERRMAEEDPKAAHEGASGA